MYCQLSVKGKVLTVIDAWAVGMDVLITEAAALLMFSEPLCTGKPHALGLEYILGSSIKCAPWSDWETDSQALWDNHQWWMYQEMGEEVVMNSSGGSAQVSSWGREEAWCGRYLFVWQWETKVEIFVSEFLSWHAGKYQSILSTP